MPDSLTAPPEFMWAHDPYLKSGPTVKDIEIRVSEMHSGKVMHRETCRDVHVNDAHALADKVLENYLSLRPPQQMAADPDWDF